MLGYRLLWCVKWSLFGHSAPILNLDFERTFISKGFYGILLIGLDIRGMIFPFLNIRNDSMIFPS